MLAWYARNQLFYTLHFAYQVSVYFFPGLAGPADLIR
jgi:hypothetical protein